jgi:putative membrane protein
MSERRLHPAAAVHEFAEQLRGLALPIIAAAILGGRGGGGGGALIYGVIGLVVALVSGIVLWRNERYSVDEDGVHHRRGLLRRQETTIPVDRVQGVDTVRGPIQRLFGVVELRVQSAGGAKGELRLRAVSAADARELRAALRLADSAPRRLPERRLGAGALLLTALTAGQIGVVIPLVAAASQFADNVLGADTVRTLVPDTATKALVLLAVVIAAAWVLSFLGTIVAFAGFTVTRDEDRLRIRRGLLQKRESSIPVARIAAVRLVESPLRQPLGRAELRLESAGYGDDPRAARTLFPLVPARAAGELLAALLPEVELPAIALAPAPPRARRRYLLVPVLLAAAATLIALVAAGGDGALAALLLPAAAALGLSRHRAAGAALAGGRVVLRRRRFARVTLVADARRLQHVDRRETILTRRARLATLGVGVASGTRLAVPNLDAGAVDELVARLAAAAR